MHTVVIRFNMVYLNFSERFTFQKSKARIQVKHLMLVALEPHHHLTVKIFGIFFCSHHINPILVSEI